MNKFRKVNLDPDQYYTQRNNKIDPLHSCMPTSRIMFYLGNGYSILNETDYALDDYFSYLLSKCEPLELANKKYHTLTALGYPPREIHGMYHSYLDPFLFGHKVSDFRLDLTYNDFMNRIDKGQVIMTSGSFGKLKGHAFCVVGRDGDHLLLADPYGNYQSEYRNKNGYLVAMNEEKFILHVKGVKKNPNIKWGHVLR